MDVTQPETISFWSLDLRVRDPHPEQGEIRVNDGNVNDLRAKSRSVMWVGKDADTYRTAQIDGQLRKSSEAATATLRSGEKMLTEQARGQEQASAS